MLRVRRGYSPQVSAFWRQTALASTELWSRIHLKVDLYANHALCVFRLGTVLHRAGMHPLEVNIQAVKISHTTLF